MRDDIIPTHYDDWRHCITELCRIPLTPAYMRERIAALEQAHSEETRRFIQSYGEVHHRRVVGWFKRALAETETTEP